jgi:hypothetical protein
MSTARTVEVIQKDLQAKIELKKSYVPPAKVPQKLLDDIENLRSELEKANMSQPEEEE